MASPSEELVYFLCGFLQQLTWQDVNAWIGYAVKKETICKKYYPKEYVRVLKYEVAITDVLKLLLARFGDSREQVTVFMGCGPDRVCLVVHLALLKMNAKKDEITEGVVFKSSYFNMKVACDWFTKLTHWIHKGLGVAKNVPVVTWKKFLDSSIQVEDDFIEEETYEEQQSKEYDIFRYKVKEWKDNQKIYELLFDSEGKYQAENEDSIDGYETTNIYDLYNRESSKRMDAGHGVSVGSSNYVSYRADRDWETL